MVAPEGYRFAASHEWAREENGVVFVGISDHAQDELGDIVFVELPRVGDTVTLGESFGTIEAVKAVSELYAPISGKVVEVNAMLETEPMVINTSPYEEGWMIKIEMTDESEMDALLSDAEYGELTA